MRSKWLLRAVLGWAVLGLAGCSSDRQPSRSAGPAAPAAQTAPLELPAIFGNNMVLQQGKAVPVWGWGEPGQNVTVEFLGQRKSALVSPDGRWKLYLDPLPPGGPYHMVISTAGSTGSPVSGCSIRFENVLVGQVWICSGQSNMEWPLKLTENWEQTVRSSRNPALRLFTVKKAIAEKPLRDLTGRWEEAGPDTVPDFSAVAYYFGRELQQNLNVPVGLVNTSWGGTPIEAWTSGRTLQQDPELSVAFDEFAARKAAADKAQAEYQKAMEAYRQQAEDARRTGKAPPAEPRKPSGPGWQPAVLYNAMIAPLTPYGIAGVIWYQGESNASNAQRYRKQMPAMIRNWREDFDQGDFPFLMVQLANYMAREPLPTDTDWARLREAQLLTLSVPKTGMAVTIDIGQANDIHPRNKLDVGRRLALAARAIAYNQNIVFSGPIYDSMTIEGTRIRLRFKHTGSGLTTRGNAPLTGFAIAGEDRRFVWAEARIEGDTVLVWSREIARPVAVRYAWANNPECNLYNREGLPASPFRTDDWPREVAR